MKTKELVYTAFNAAMICILAPISIPITGYVPISLATLAVMLGGCLFGKKIGTISTMIYILLGCIGLPVFASYSSGFGVVVGMTGGYIIGYIPLAYLSGLFGDMARSKHGFNSYIILMCGMILGTIILYTVGTIYFEYLMHLPLWSALMACVIPFLLGDLIKMIIVCILSNRLKKYMK